MKNLILFIFFLIPELLFAQVHFSEDFNISTGTPYKVIDASNKQYFADANGNSIAVKTMADKIIIQHYDVEGMREISRTEYTDFPEERKLEKIMRTQDRILYFYSTPTSAKTKLVHVREINIVDARLGPSKTLFETKGEVVANPGILNPDEVNIYGGVFGVMNFFDISQSADHKKILIRYRRKPVVRNDDINFDVLGFYTFDYTTEKLWGNEFKMPYTEKVMDNLSYAIAVNGTVYMLAYIREAKQLELLTIDGSTAIKTKRLDLKLDTTLYIQEIRMHENVEGHLIFTGYTANVVKSVHPWLNGTKGIYSFKVTTTGIVLESKLYEFPINLINEYEKKSQKKYNDKLEEKGKAGIPYLKIVSVVNNPDGSTIIVGEQTYVIVKKAGGSTTMDQYYDDVIVAKIDIAGNLAWVNKIPKIQTGGNGRGEKGIKFVVGDGCYFVFFLDNKENATLTKDGDPFRHINGVGYMTAYKIDNVSGTCIRHSLFDVDNVNGTEMHQYATSRFLVISNKIFMIEIYTRDKQDNMIKIQVKE